MIAEDSSGLKNNTVTLNKSAQLLNKGLFKRSSCNAVTQAELQVSIQVIFSFPYQNFITALESVNLITAIFTGLSHTLPSETFILSPLTEKEHVLMLSIATEVLWTTACRLIKV